MKRIEELTQGRFPAEVHRNAAPAKLYEHAVLFDGGKVTKSGGLAALSGKKTGRSPRDKRIVSQDSVEADVWWGEVNVPISEASFQKVRQQATDYLDNSDHLYVLDAFAGWETKHQLKIRVICSRAYHALFMHNMLIRPTEQELADFGEPDYVIYNAGCQAADESIEGCLLYTSPSPRDATLSRMPSSA